MDKDCGLDRPFDLSNGHHRTEKRTRSVLWPKDGECYRESELAQGSTEAQGGRAQEEDPLLHDEKLDREVR